MMRLVVHITALLILVGGSAASAQQEPGTETTIAESGDTPRAEDHANTQDDKAASTRPGKPDESPHEYRASEQISEDLSVSFPVDI